MSERSKITLMSGRMIYLEYLKQYQTYGGLLEGSPYKEFNQKLIEHLIKKEQDKAWDKAKPYLIEPFETLQDDDESHPFGPVVTLPAIICIAEFHAMRPARDSNMDFSDLKIIWFQDDWAFPIDEAILEQN